MVLNVNFSIYAICACIYLKVVYVGVHDIRMCVQIYT